MFSHVLPRSVNRRVVVVLYRSLPKYPGMPSGRSQPRQSHPGAHVSYRRRGLREATCSSVEEQIREERWYIEEQSGSCDTRDLDF